MSKFNQLEIALKSAKVRGLIRTPGDNSAIQPNTSGDQSSKEMQSVDRSSETRPER